MEYDFLVNTYETERLKTLGVWSTFMDDDLPVRPHPLDKRDRNALEHMVHQCLSENKWFCNMFGIDVERRPCPVRKHAWSLSNGMLKIVESGLPLSKQRIKPGGKPKYPFLMLRE